MHTNKKYIWIIVVLFLALLPASIAEGGKGTLSHSFLKYNEAPELQAMVEKGQLPPVEERLPENPKVMRTPEIGVYGGSYVFGIPATGRSGQFNSYSATPLWNVHFSEGLVAPGEPDDRALEPNLAERWEYSEGGKVLTIWLRKGIKWSDGVPFTVDDVLFTYYDVIRSDTIPTGARGTWQVDGVFAEMEKIDDYTFKLIMPVPMPNLLAWEMSENRGQFHLLPKHEMMKVHPDFNSNATLEDWNSARSVQNKPAVLTGWAPASVEGNFIFSERNPYYWKVDEKGNQLPYFNEYVFAGYAGRAAQVLGFMSGENDTTVEGQAFDVYPTLKRREAERPFTIWNSNDLAKGLGIEFNLDAPDPSVRAVFRDNRFIKALNYAIDRDEFLDIFDLAGAWTTLIPGPDTLWSTPELWEKYAFDYNPEKAKQLLDEMGLRDTDGDGIREFPSGTPRAGEDFTFGIMSNANQTDRVRGMEVAVEQLNRVGVKAFQEVQAGTLTNERRNSSNFDAWGERGLFNLKFIDKLPQLIVPWSPSQLPLFQRKSGWEEPLEWQIPLKEALVRAQRTVDLQAQAEIVQEVLPLMAENAPFVMIIYWTTYFGIADRLGNNYFELNPSVLERGSWVWGGAFAKTIRAERMFDKNLK